MSITFEGERKNNQVNQQGNQGPYSRILIFEIIVVFTIISNIKILSLRLSVSAILEIFRMRLSVTFLLKLPTCRNFYDELYQPTLQHVQWHLCLWRHTLCQVDLGNVFDSLLYKWFIIMKMGVGITSPSRVDRIHPPPTYP